MIEYINDQFTYDGVLIFADCKHIEKCKKKNALLMNCKFCKNFIKKKQRFYKDKYLQNELDWLDGNDPI